MLTLWAPNSGADPAEHAGTVAVAEHRDVVLELNLEALAPGLQQVRAVTVSDHRPGDAAVCRRLVTVTRIMSV